MVRVAVEGQTKKIVMTGAASSIVGQKPETKEGFVYDNPLHWADLEEMKRPNERAKFMAERTTWALVSDKQNNEGTRTHKKENKNDQKFKINLKNFRFSGFSACLYSKKFN